MFFNKLVVIIKEYIPRHTLLLLRTSIW